MITEGTYDPAPYFRALIELRGTLGITFFWQFLTNGSYS